MTVQPYATDAGLAGIAGSPTESAALIAAQGRMGLVVVKFFDRDGACRDGAFNFWFPAPQRGLLLCYASEVFTLRANYRKGAARAMNGPLRILLEPCHLLPAIRCPWGEGEPFRLRGGLAPRASSCRQVCHLRCLATRKHNRSALGDSQATLGGYALCLGLCCPASGPCYPPLQTPWQGFRLHGRFLTQIHGGESMI